MRVQQRPRFALAGGVIALLAALGLSSIVQQTTPDAAAQFAPIAVRAALGEWATGRAIEAQASEPRFVTELISESDGRPFPTNGRWLLVDVNGSCVWESCLLQSASLAVGEEEFRASERLGSESISRALIAAGIVSSGVIAFELPFDIASRPGADTAELRFSAAFDERLDSQLIFEFDLSALPEVKSAIASRPVTVGAR